jgi:signal peptidase I
MKTIKDRCLSLNMKALENRGTLRVTCHGSSMFPRIMPGQEVTIKKANLSDLRFSDLVVYNKESRWIVHRYLLRFKRSGRDMLLLKGDHNLQFDKPIPASQIVGKVGHIKTRSPLQRFASICLGTASLAMGVVYATIISRLKSKKREITKEENILVTLSLINPAKREIEYVRSSNEQGVDWKRILLLSRHHLVFPRIYKNIKKHSIMVPNEIKQEFAKLHMYNQRRNKIILNETEKVIKRLKDSDIRFIILKGISVVKATSSKPDSRFMADIDILVDEHQVQAAESILKKYRFKPSPTRKSREDCLDRGEHDCLYQKKALGENVQIELHWDIIDRYNPFNIALEDVWKNTTQIRFNSLELDAMPVEHMIIHLCLHVSFSHAFHNAPLRDLADISEIIKNNRIRWQTVIKTSEKWRTCSFIFYVLKVLNESFRTNIPESVLKRLNTCSDKGQLFGLHMNPLSSIIKPRPKHTLKFLFLELLWTNNTLDKIKIINRAAKKVISR